MMSKSFEPRCEREEKDEDWWYKEEEAGCCLGERGRYQRDQIVAEECVAAVASTYEDPERKCN